MKTQTLTKIPTQQQFVEAYEQFLHSIIENAVTLGGMLVAMMEHRSATIDELADKGFSRITLNRLYNIGLGRLDPRLLIDDSPASQVIRELPLPQQKQLLDEGVPVVVELAADGKGIQKVKPVSMLTTKEVKKVFREDASVRPPVEQAQIVRTEKHQPKPEPAQRFKVAKDGETILVLEKTEFTLSQWYEIGELAKEQQLKFLESNLKKGQIPGK